MEAVKEALAKHTEPALPVDRDPQSIRDEILELNTRRRQMLGVEMEARRAIERRIAVLNQQAEMGALGLPKLDPVVLRWRHKSSGTVAPWPRLAVVSIVDPVMRIAHRAGWNGLQYRPRGSVSPSIPHSATIYSDILDRFASTHRRRDVDLTYVFRGAIPDPTRDKIIAAQHARTFEEIMLVCEAPVESWQLKIGPKQMEAKQRRLLEDPIVVGVAHGSFWVIDVFDPTPIEEIVQTEFTR